MRRDRSKGKKTAAEFMQRLEADPASRARRNEQNRIHEERVRIHRAHSKPVVDELESAGYAIESLDQLRRSGQRYDSAIPVLLRWLPLVQDPSVKESIVGTLAVPWASPMATEPLIREFLQARDDADGLKWAIGNALSIVATEAETNQMIDLAKDNRHGTARQMIVVALGRMRPADAVPVLIDLLSDEEVCGHAIIALRDIRAVIATPEIARFRNHPTTWIRKEAEKTLTKFAKLAGR